jgi:hypothetical protein
MGAVLVVLIAMRRDASILGHGCGITAQNPDRGLQHGIKAKIDASCLSVLGWGG